MKKLLVYLKEYKRETVLAPLFKMLEASFELFVPLVMAKIIDIGIREGDSGYIFRMGLVLVALGLVGLASSVTAQFFAAKAAVGFSTKLKHVLFSHIQSMNYGEIDQAGVSTLVTRLTSDVNQVQSGVNLVLRLFLRSPFIVFGAMVMAFTIDVRSALVFVVAIPLLSVVVFGIMLISIPLYRKVQSALDRVLGLTRENLSGVRVIRAFHQEDKERARFSEDNGALADIQMFVGKISALMNPLTYVIVNAAILVLLYTGALQVDAGRLTQGEVIAIVNYMSQILVELVKLANLIITVTKAAACANRIEAVLERPTGMEVIAAQAGEDTERADAPAVEFREVGLTYPGAGAEALSRLNVIVKRGETVGVIGGTGSGKSSLVQMIPRFYDATAGKVLVNGKDVKSYDPAVLKAKVGMVPQRAVLFRGTVRDNLRWGREDASDEELWEALSAAQAKDFVEGKQGGLDFVISQGGKNLSGGQKQRLTIARALVRRPEILILDDSASALDYATDAALRAAIRNLEGTMTTFLVSQRTASVLHADRILVLDDGEIVGMGTHEELLNHCAVYREIYESQLTKPAGESAGGKAAKEQVGGSAGVKAAREQAGTNTAGRKGGR